jgi:hypothetical protein
MADIKIYGTLKNDTGEPIAYASQVIDEATGKTIDELLSGSGSIDANEISDDTINELAKEILES